MSNILKYQSPSSPLLNPHKIIENIPAREWGPRKINEDGTVTEGEGTSFWRAPFQYWGNKGFGLQNEKIARDLVSEFDQMRSKNPDYNYILDKNYQSYDDAINYLNHLEGLKKYLRLPYDTGLLMESKYKPTRLQGTNEKTYKFKSSTVPGYWNDVVEDMVMGEHSKNQYYDQSLNEFTAYRDRDEKGDFISIYDEWDYNPAVRGGNKKLNKVIDSVTGGTPFVIYDRVYLDDYYDIPEEARGNPFITPAVVTAEAKKSGGIIKAQNSAKLISKINQSGANFVKRLLDPNRKSIPDWETKGQKIATHKMSWGEDDHGAYVFPEVQEINGQLIDFSRPPYAPGIADYLARKNNNIVRMSPEEADWFTKNYKQYYPSFKKGGRMKNQRISLYPKYGSWARAKFAYDSGYRDPEAMSALFANYVPDQIISKSSSHTSRTNGVENDDFQSYYKTTGNNLGIEQKLSRINGNETDITTFLLPNGDTYTEDHINGTGQYSIDFAKRLEGKLPKPKSLFEEGGILKAQEGTGNNFWSKLWNAVKAGGMAARDARVGAVGAQQVRDLYSEGKTEEAQELAKKYAKANTTGIALASGAATSSLLGDLAVTGATTAADTFIDGDVDNFGRNFLFNAAADAVGHGAGKLLRNVDWGKIRNSVELISDNTKADVSEYINTVDNALSERQPLTTNKFAVWGSTSESKLTEAERLGIPKGQRSNPKALDNPQYWGYEQWNERYNAAIQSGNQEEVQRLRDLHFKIKAPDTKFVTNDGFPQHNYHGGQKGITVFLNAKDNPNYHQTRHQGYSHPETRSGIYFSKYIDSAKNYKYRKNGEVYDVYLNASRPYKQTYTTTLMNRFKNLNPFQRYFDPAIIRNIDLETTLKDFDSVKHSDVENVVWDGKRIKLANGITYDDSGNIISIVKRDNFRNVDSRYQQGGKL